MPSSSFRVKRSLLSKLSSVYLFISSILLHPGHGHVGSGVYHRNAGRDAGTHPGSDASALQDTMHTYSTVSLVGGGGVIILIYNLLEVGGNQST